jgi:predicted dehydrogenase
MSPRTGVKISKPSSSRRPRKVKVAVFGARRGRGLALTLAADPRAELVAICDMNKTALAAAKADAAKAGARVTSYTDADDFFNHDFDAVVLANYANEHAPFAVQALLSGRHVLSEVLAIQTLGEAVPLVEAVESSKKVYAYAENYCYFRSTQEMRRLYRRGDLGEFQHGEGEYVHNCEPIWPEIAYGEPRHWRNVMYSTYYCTHSLGPLIHITGTRPTKVVGFETPPTGASFGALGGTSAMELCQMSNGATVKSLHAGHLKREPNSIWYAVYGTKGMAESDRWGDRFNAVNLYLEGDKGTPYARHYVPSWPVVKDDGLRADGHGGGDFFTLHYFLEKILGRPAGSESIDVYTALDMTTPGILAYKSILDGNRPYDVPDFRKKSVRAKYHADDFHVDPKAPGAWPPSSSFGVPKVPESVYARQRKLYAEYLKRAAHS